jgi:nucleoside-triphosphatase
VKGLLVVTGAPGVGKTTLMTRLIERLRARGVRVGGIISYEKRHLGRRVGFEILALSSGERGMLATESHGLGPRVGRYVVNLETLARVAAPSILEAIRSADVIVVDEVGPMELFSPEFRRAVEACLESDKTLLMVVHERSRDPLVRRIREEAGGDVVVVDAESRDSLVEPLEQRVIGGLAAKG